MKNFDKIVNEYKTNILKENTEPTLKMYDRWEEKNKDHAEKENTNVTIKQIMSEILTATPNLIQYNNPDLTLEEAKKYLEEAHDIISKVYRILETTEDEPQSHKLIKGDTYYV